MQTWATDSATENYTAGGVELGDIKQGNLRGVFGKLARLVRGKRWGKSPPLVWQQARHGKPRVVQGQIGGESRPGSPSVRLSERFRCDGASQSSEQPSGRLLEPRRKARPRGMIATMRGSLTRAAHFDKIRLTGSPAIFLLSFNSVRLWKHAGLRGHICRCNGFEWRRSERHRRGWVDGGEAGQSDVPDQAEPL
jgi:hypothetical protein